MNDVKDYQKQLREIEKNLDGQPVALPPTRRSAEEQYVERLRHLSYDASATMEGRDLVVDLLGRVLLWSEIMMHRYVLNSARSILSDEHTFTIIQG